jgi:hypothetical protein
MNPHLRILEIEGSLSFARNVQENRFLEGKYIDF